MEADGIKDWVSGVADTVAGVAKRAAGEFGARPDLVLEGEAQQAKGSAELAGSATQPGDQVSGWKLDREQRLALIAQFPPKHAFTVADHVTLEPDVAADAPPPPQVHAEIVGRIDDGKGVEAMVVSIDGSTERPDAGTYHITWSLGPGRRASESNEVIARLGWTPLPQGIAVELHPAIFA
jgi:uncharacterized protein YjbJ (UPF0337 family)